MWGYGWGWFFGALMMLVFWGGLIALVVFLVRSSGDGSRGSSEGLRGSNARAILEERFARGEISKEEFEECKRVLDGKAA
jgi:putative membrane protein